MFFVDFLKGGQFAPKDSDGGSSQSEDQGAFDPSDITNNLDDPTRGSNPVAGEGASRNAATAAAEASEEVAERQAVRGASREAIREAALGAEKKAIRLAARRAFRAAIIDALKNIGEKVALTEIPVVGVISDISTVYDVYRFVKEFEELRVGIKAATRFVNEGAHTLSDLRVSQRLETFPNYRAFLKLESSTSIAEELDVTGELEKRFGRAGDGMSYHHIVERSAGEAENFTETTENIVKIPTILHEAINARYYRIDPELGMSLHAWLRTKPFSVKREWGIKVLKELGIVVGN